MSEGQRSLALLLYKSCLRATTNWQKEVARGVAAEVLRLPHEAKRVYQRLPERVQKNGPGILAIALEGENSPVEATKRLWRRSAVTPPTTPKEEEERLDDAMAAMRTFNKRVGALSPLVYETTCSHLTEPQGIRIDVASAMYGVSANLAQYVYRVTIKNVHPTNTYQLVSRHWKIMDSEGKVENVKGPGVVGEQPILQPNQEHTYSSGTTLRTGECGTMEGSYQFITVGDEGSSGTMFDAKISPFGLNHTGRFAPPTSSPKL
ncbi:Co2+/Mg2+ efflux protein ApaG [Balamuthia mandrillaris]